MVNSKALGRSGYRRGSLSICRRREERIDQELPPLRTFLFEQDQGIDRTKVVERTGLTREFALHPPPEGATFLATHARTTRSEIFLFLFIYFIFYVLSGGRSRIYSHPDDYASFHLRGIFFFSPAVFGFYSVLLPFSPKIPWTMILFLDGTGCEWRKEINCGSLRRVAKRFKRGCEKLIGKYILIRRNISSRNEWDNMYVKAIEES